MKNFLFLLIVVLLLGCFEKTVGIDELEINDNLIYHKGKLFNGKVNYNIGDFKILKNGAVLMPGKHDEFLDENLYDFFRQVLIDEYNFIGNFKMGEKNGIWTWFYLNGNKRYEINFINGIKDGAYNFWYENGQLELESIYKEGEINGNQIRYFKDGSKSSEIYYEAGKQDGPFKMWFSNGQIKLDFFYKDGKSHGSWKKWDEFGRIETEANFKNGEKHGNTKYYIHKYGPQVEKEFNYKNGKLDGAQRQWDENGILKYEINYKNGEVHGLEKSWDNYGELISRERWKDGKYDSSYKDVILSNRSKRSIDNLLKFQTDSTIKIYN
tara:strand:- start:45 stop:1016 length:972 start_codon:yes stop_codon:yes gene_type:complete